MTSTAPLTFAQILEAAVSQPGTISTAFRAFHNYSLGNQLLALFQCQARGITPGPLATFMGWKAKGRAVRKGEKAIVLCMPFTCKRRRDDDTEDAETISFTKFGYKPHWFVLSQTDGEDVPVLDAPTWSAPRALAALDIAEKPFDDLNGNVGGYAQGRSITVSPLTDNAHATRFHELAHIVLGHTAETEIRTPKEMREVEAEAVALLCLEALVLPGAEQCRGYIQHWNRGGNPIPERHAQRIFKAADTILRAGREEIDDQAAAA